jgi:hypothetical protein
MGENGQVERPLEIVPVQDSGIVLMPVMNIQAAKKRLAEFQEFVKEYLVPDEDYGTIPGTPKPTLLKPGADKLCELYGLADDFTIESRTENYQAEPPLFDYTLKCTLTSRRDGRLVGTGFGSCNSWEGKYRYRDSKRKCPLCGKEAIIPGKAEYGGGWLCWKKREGCGAKFLETDEAITSQKAGKEINDDVPTLKNTILKMAKKRAKIDAVIAVTRSSGIFTQDMEDIVEGANADTGQGTRESARRVAEQKNVKAKKEVQAPAACIFYTEPPSQNGHYVEFLNLREFVSQKKELEETILLLFSNSKGKKTKDGTTLVPAENVPSLLEKLAGDYGLTVKKLEAAHA